MPLHEGQLVTVNDDDGPLHGVVFNVPNVAKAVVAVPDAEHGAVFRTVPTKKLRARTVAGPNDDELRHLIRKTPGKAPRGANRAGQAAIRGLPAHARPRGHRTTGK